MDDSLALRFKQQLTVADADAAASRAVKDKSATDEREAEQRAIEAERKLCNTAERLLNNWLRPALEEFRKVFPFSELNTSESPDRVMQVKRSKRAILSGFHSFGNVHSAIAALIYVASESELNLSIEIEVLPGRQSHSEYSIDLQGNPIGLVDAANSTKILHTALGEALVAMTRIAGTMN